MVVLVQPQFVGCVVQSRTVVAHKFIHDHVCQFVNVISIAQFCPQLVAVTQLVHVDQYHDEHVK